MQELGQYSLDLKQLSTINNQFGCDLVYILANHFRTNQSRHSANWHLVFLRPPADAFEKLHNHHLKSFHKGRTCDLGLNGVHVETRKFRHTCAENQGMAPYIAYKRAEARDREAVAQILTTRGSKSAEWMFNHPTKERLIKTDVNYSYSLLQNGILNTNVSRCSVI